MTLILLLTQFVVACSNDLPPTGNCLVSSDGKKASVTPVALGTVARFDDLQFAPALRRVIAVALGRGHMYLVNPDTSEVQDLVVGGSVASADASVTRIYAVDRASARIVVFDPVTGLELQSQYISGRPDYIRVSPTSNEVWITAPGRDSILIHDATTLALVDEIAVASPEGLTFDSAGRAYTQHGGDVIALDVATHSVAGVWNAGCAGSHGFPQSDVGFGLVFAGCDRSGGTSVLRNNGELVSGYEAGGDEAALAFSNQLHHLYVRGDPGDTLAILAVCSGGALGVLDQVPISGQGHVSAADDRGHVWVADATTGGLLRIDDPFGVTQ
jgi:DNA-binding beta-propeller fold protein YncE